MIPEQLPNSFDSAAVPTTFARSGPAEVFDDIYRVVSDTATAHVSKWKTSEFRSYMQAFTDVFKKDLTTLRSVVYWQKHKLDYQGVYTAFLLGALGEDDFMQEAEKYAAETRSLPAQFIADQISDITRLLGHDVMTPADAAEFLRTDLTQVLDVLQQRDLFATELIRESARQAERSN